MPFQTLERTCRFSGRRDQTHQEQSEPARHNCLRFLGKRTTFSGVLCSSQHIVIGRPGDGVGIKAHERLWLLILLKMGRLWSA